MRIIVCENADAVAKEAAKIFAAQVYMKPNSVLGLATGSTPVGMYKILADMNQKGEISFKDCKSFNLDEYYPLAPTHDQSYRYFMNVNFFDHIDIDKANTRVPDGLAEDPAAMGAEYDAAIDAAGGVDIQVLGIGQNGHIAFNEPDEKLVAGTHLTSLTESTINANARFFEKKEDVPTQAVTMGMASIMKAKTIILLATGKAKHQAVAELLDDKITTSNPATLLKLHPNTIILVDKDAYNG